jgi:hypothetical protein
MAQNNPYRSSSDNEDNNSHPHTRAEGHSGGNAGAGKSGGEDMGSEKKIDDERFGSRKADGTNDVKDEGKKDAPGRRDADSVQTR